MRCSGITTRGGCVIELLYIWEILQRGLTPPSHCPQFQYGGDSRKGPVVSPQEAQAQAILQQAQVHVTAACT